MSLRNERSKTAAESSTSVRRRQARSSWWTSTKPPGRWMRAWKKSRRRDGLHEVPERTAVAIGQPRIAGGGAFFEGRFKSVAILSVGLQSDGDPELGSLSPEQG